MRLPSFFAAFVLALITSASLVQQRLAHGAPATLLWSLGFMFGALLLWRAAEARDALTHFVAQLAGAFAGSLTAHAWLVNADDALVESVRQFTNDAVFVSVIIAAVWALKLGSRAMVLLVTPALLLAAYRATSGFWHVDPFPSGVQEFVLSQSIAVLLGLLAFDLVWSQRSTPT